MRIKPLIVKKVEPVLVQHGFQPDYRHADYLFLKTDGTQSIGFDTDKYRKKLRVFFQVMTDVRFSFYLSDLNPDFCPIAEAAYSTQEELARYIDEISDALSSTILPYMDAMAVNEVKRTMGMTQALAENTLERAARFANAWGLSMDCKDRRNLQALDLIIQRWQTDPWHRRGDFYPHESELIDMAAYFGELLNIKWDGKWYWRELSQGSKFYAAGDGYDPLERVLHAWNHGPEIINYAFSRFPM